MEDVIYSPRTAVFVSNAVPSSFIATYKLDDDTAGRHFVEADVEVDQRSPQRSLTCALRNEVHSLECIQFISSIFQLSFIEGELSVFIINLIVRVGVESVPFSA